MRHRKTGKKFGRKKGPREAMLRNLATSVVMYESVKTTETKAKAIKPVVEKYITKSRDNSLHTRRQLIQFFYDENAVKKLLEELGPRYKERPGGYLRITKLGRRVGDNAPMARLEFVK